MKKGILVSIMAVVMLSVMGPAAALAADNPAVDKDSSGYGTLNPAAQAAAQVMGYGDQTAQPYCARNNSCVPSLYMNYASKIAANAIGYYEYNTVVQEPSKNPADLPILSQ